ncbi:MAG: hypothetical protein U9Q40_03990 [Campylobacterota bacterium]|nr:hypothetical protein [Campylobacterota bacterium]
MKIILLAFFIITTLCASDDKKASTIFNLIAKNITKKTAPNIYLHKYNKSIKKYPGNLNIVTKCEEADLVILSTTKDIPQECSKKILFGTRYSHLKNSNVLGAFFWQKGRPNILFYQERLKREKIKLSPSFDKYIEP